MAQITAEAIRAVNDHPGAFEQALRRHAARFSLAADQWGLITHSQAGRAGVPHATFDRLVDDEDLVERVRRADEIGVRASSAR